MPQTLGPAMPRPFPDGARPGGIEGAGTRGICAGGEVVSSVDSARRQPVSCTDRSKRSAARRGGGIPSRASSCNSLASRRRRQRSAASRAAAPGAGSCARRRDPRKEVDHGSAPATSQSRPAAGGRAKPARKSSTVAASSVTAAVAPKRSTSTTADLRTPVTSATSVRRSRVRGSRETPARYTIARVGGVPRRRVGNERAAAAAAARAAATAGATPSRALIGWGRPRTTGAFDEVPADSSAAEARDGRADGAGEPVGDDVAGALPVCLRRRCVTNVHVSSLLMWARGCAGTTAAAASALSVTGQQPRGRAAAESEAGAASRLPPACEEDRAAPEATGSRVEVGARGGCGGRCAGSALALRP